MNVISNGRFRSGVLHGDEVTELLVPNDAIKHMKINKATNEDKEEQEEDKEEDKEENEEVSQEKNTVFIRRIHQEEITTEKLNFFEAEKAA